MTTTPLERIRLDGGTQARAELDSEVVKEYAAAYRAGQELPPVVLFDEGENLWMADGFHRYGGAKAAGREQIDADIRQGTLRDAVLFAVGSNTGHGLRRSSQDKRKAVGMILADPEWATRSDNWIAQACRVSDHLVADVRASSGRSSGSTSRSRSSKEGRKGKDGKTRPARKGKSQTTGDANEGPILCPRCQRIGAVEGCHGCQVAREEAESAAHKKGKKAGAQKSGQALYDWRAFHDHFGGLVRQVTQLGKLYGAKDSADAERLERRLSDFKKAFTDWHTALTRKKK